MRFKNMIVIRNRAFFKKSDIKKMRILMQIAKVCLSILMEKYYLGVEMDRR